MIGPPGTDETTRQGVRPASPERGAACAGGRFRLGVVGSEEGVAPLTDFAGQGLAVPVGDGGDGDRAVKRVSWVTSQEDMNPP